MMRFHTILIALLCFATSQSVQAAGIDFFHGSWEEVLAEAEKQNKPIFVDAYTTWCGPCKKMASMTFPDAEVGQFYNKYFVNYKMDMEKGEGPEFKNKYKISSFPTLLFIDAKGQVISRVSGFRMPKDFIDVGKRIVKDKELLKDLQQRYTEGERSNDFLFQYIEQMSLANEPVADVVKFYFEQLPDNEKYNDTNLDLIFKSAQSIDNPLFDMMIAERGKFDDKYQKENVDNQIKKAILGGVDQAIKKKDKATFDKAMKFIPNVIDKEKWSIAEFELTEKYYSGIKDWKAYAKYTSSYLKKNSIDNPALLNKIAWSYYEHIDSKKILEQGKKLAEQSISLKSNYNNNDTYAALLFKLGETTNAIFAAEKAITIAKHSNKKYDKTTQLIKQYQ